jgi:hypothetical protein
MTATPQEKAPLARLIIFIVCLALAGSVAAGIYYLAIDLPGQDSAKVPQNSVNPDEVCQAQRQACYEGCNSLFNPSDRFECLHACGKASNDCYANPPGDNP